MFSPLFPSFKFQQGTFRKQQSNLDVLELTFGMNQHKQHFFGPGKQPLPFMSINLKPLKPANPVRKSGCFPGRKHIFVASEVLPVKKKGVSFCFCKTSSDSCFIELKGRFFEVWRFAFRSEDFSFTSLKTNYDIVENHH